LTVLKFAPFGAHIAASGGADMPLTGEVIPGESFYCPHCVERASYRLERGQQADQKTRGHAMSERVEQDSGVGDP
jgi:hypothetical protein